jgi:outer membrane protein assembly factor BamD (BamD/ComL family)
MVYYREVVDKHPDSSFAAAARSKLEELNKKVARKGS